MVELEEKTATSVTQPEKKVQVSSKSQQFHDFSAKFEKLRSEKEKRRQESEKEVPPETSNNTPEPSTSIEGPVPDVEQLELPVKKTHISEPAAVEKIPSIEILPTEGDQKEEKTKLRKKQGSMLDVLPQQSPGVKLGSEIRSRPRAPGRRLPSRPSRANIRKRKLEEEKRAQLLRQRSIPRAVRNIDKKSFSNAMQVPGNASAIAAQAMSARGSMIQVRRKSVAVPREDTHLESTEAQSVLQRLHSNTTSEAPQLSINESGLTEAEKMRQRIMREKSEGSGTKPLSARDRQDEGNKVVFKKKESMDYETLIEIRRKEAQERKKEEEIQERQRVISNFRERSKTKTDFTNKLIHLKGRSHVRSFLLPLCVESLNEGDAFILCCEQELFVWNGLQANRMEKSKAVALTKRITFNEMGGRSEIINIPRRDGDEQVLEDKIKQFWSLLSGSASEVRSAETGGNDIAYERMFYSNLTLEKVVCGENVQLGVEEVDFGGRLSAQILENDTCFFLEAPPSTIFLWTGKQATNECREFAINYAKGLNKNYLLKESDGGESTIFREQFFDWGDFPRPLKETTPKLKKHVSSSAVRISTLKRREVKSMMEKRREEKDQIDVLHLHSLTYTPKEEITDDGKSGELEIWHIDKSDLVPLTPDKYGHFYSGDSYVLLYTYIPGGVTGQSLAKSSLIYYWQGQHSRHKERGTSALKTAVVKKVAKSRGTDANVVRVVQGKENLHFLKIFEGRMIIHRGHKNKQSGRARLYHVHDEEYSIIRAVETKCNSIGLNSRDVFILMKDQTQLIWNGVAASDHLRQLATNFATILAESKQETIKTATIEEGKENSFWKKCVGSKPYANADWLTNKSAPFRCKLFSCSSIWKIQS